MHPRSAANGPSRSGEKGLPPGAAGPRRQPDRCRNTADNPKIFKDVPLSFGSSRQRRARRRGGAIAVGTAPAKNPVPDDSHPRPGKRPGVPPAGQGNAAHFGSAEVGFFIGAGIYRRRQAPHQE